MTDPRSPARPERTGGNRTEWKRGRWRGKSFELGTFRLMSSMGPGVLPDFLLFPLIVMSQFQFCLVTLGLTSINGSGGGGGVAP